MSASADLVVVSSPLQYVNAAEWAQACGGDADLVLIGDRAGGDAATLALVGRRPGLWRSVRSHPKRPQAPRWLPALARDALDAGHRASLERLAGQLGARRRVVFGDYRNVSQRALVAGVRHDELVLVDDGSVAPQVAAVRSGARGAPEPERFSPGWMRGPLGQAAFGERAPPAPAALTFFSIYAPLMAPMLGPPDRLLPHAYERWRAQARPAGRCDEVWVLGSNHVEAGICSAEAYRGLLLAGLSALRAGGRKRAVIYRPHRGEDAGRARALARDGGMAVADAQLPVEVGYLDAASRPELAVVVASSAADTLSVIDPELNIMRLAPPPGYLRARRDHILAVIAGHDAFNPRLRVLETGEGTA